MNYLNKRIIIFFSASIITISIVMFSWFKSGSIISNSEESLSIYNPERTAQIYSSIWYPIGLGSRSAFGLVRYPVFSALSFLSNLGFPSFIIQAILIGLSMEIAILSAYLLFNYLSKGSFLISFVGAFFYVFNTYTQAQIFRRFLYPYMYALAYYPLFLYLWIKLLEERKWKYLLLFSISSAFFSFSFDQVATLIPFIISAFIILLIKFWQNRNSLKRVIFLIGISLFSLTLVILVNIWWIYPFIISTKSYLSIVSTFSTSQVNLNSLEAVSKFFPISQILLLRQSWWYGESQHWYNYYQNPLIFLLSFSVFFITFYGLIKSRVSKFFPILSILFVIGLLVCKGSNPPFGKALFSFLFENFTFTAALRNPYEKFGIVLLLPYCFFFASGLSYLMRGVRGKFVNLALLLSFVFFILILVWPIFSGNVFTKEELINVPISYKEANNYLNKNSSLRIFHVPLSRYYNEKYDWGFYGQNPTIYLFDRTSLSDSLNVFMEPFYKQMPELASNKDFPKILGYLGVSNIIVHNDSINKPEDNLLTIDHAKGWEKVKQAVKFGKLDIYTIDPQILRSNFYAIKLSNQNIQTYKDRRFLDFSFLNDDIINLKSQKLSPGKYFVEVKDVTEPFVLVFNETFDNYWTASINSQNLTDHFPVDKMFNGWYVDKKGNYTIDIKLKVWPWD